MENQIDDTLSFINVDKKPIVRVVGAGNVGGKIVNCLIEKNVEYTDFIALNTDETKLKISKSSTKIQISDDLIKELSLNNNTSLNSKEIEKFESQIEDVIIESDFLIITAAMGDEGCALTTPIVAKKARELGGRLILGVVTKPLSTAGEKVLKQAQEEIDKLKEYADSVIIISNDKFKDADDKSSGVPEGYTYVENIVRYNIQCVIGVATVPGMICEDFLNVYVVFKNKGTAFVGVGHGKGPNMFDEALEKAYDSLSLETEFDKFKDVFCYIIGGSSDRFVPYLQLFTAVSNKVRTLGPGSSLLTGVVFHDVPDDEAIVIIGGTGVEDA